MIYPDIIAGKAYRYMPWKDNEKDSIDYLVLKMLNESEYLIMVLGDNFSTEEEDVWYYGETKITDWYIDIKEISFTEFDYEMACLVII